MSKQKEKVHLEFSIVMPSLGRLVCLPPLLAPVIVHVNHMTLGLLGFWLSVRDFCGTFIQVK